MQQPKPLVYLIGTSQPIFGGGGGLLLTLLLEEQVVLEAGGFEVEM